MNEKPPRKRKLKGCLITLLVLGVLVFVVVPYGLRSFLRSRMSPDQIAVIERAYKPPQVPTAWAQVKQLTSGTQAALAAFGDAFRKRSANDALVEFAPGAALPDRKDKGSISTFLAQMAKGQLLSPAERADAATLVKQEEELVVATLALSGRPDFDTGAADKPIGGISDVEFLGYQTAAKIVLLGARLDALDGETSRGLATATSVLGLARRDPASSLISQLIAIAVNQMTIRTITDIAAQCDDPAALRATLAEMKRLDAQVNIPMPEDIRLADILGNLRALKRENYPVDLDFSKPTTYLFDQSLDSMLRFPEWKMQHLSPNDPLRAKYAQMLADRTGTTGQPQTPKILKLFKYAGPYTDVARDMLLTMDPLNYPVMSISQKVASARFHLTTLALGERIAKLEGAAAPSAPGDLVPKYLTPEPMDPFTNASFPRSASGEFYSLGPDKLDDQGVITYNATNGTISTGDIVMRAPE